MFGRKFFRTRRTSHSTNRRRPPAPPPAPEPSPPPSPPPPSYPKKSKPSSRRKRRSSVAPVPPVVLSPLSPINQKDIDDVKLERETSYRLILRPIGIHNMNVVFGVFKLDGTMVINGILVPLKGRDQINVVFNAVSEYLRTLSRDERIDTQLLIDDPLNNDTYELTLSGGKILESRKMIKKVARGFKKMLEEGGKGKTKKQKKTKTKKKRKGKKRGTKRRS
tara:strand:+ start:1691 stop:2353 length:663 start_codon:yes stop_codon:yes gene_type:complete